LYLFLRFYADILHDFARKPFLLPNQGSAYRVLRCLTTILAQISAAKKLHYKVEVNFARCTRHLDSPVLEDLRMYFSHDSDFSASAHYCGAPSPDKTGIVRFF
jgi:hypothetical protein